jgi:hypothetical protein
VPMVRRRRRRAKGGWGRTRKNTDEHGPTRTGSDGGGMVDTTPRRRSPCPSIFVRGGPCGGRFGMDEHGRTRTGTDVGGMVDTTPRRRSPCPSIVVRGGPCGGRFGMDEHGPARTGTDGGAWLIPRPAASVRACPLLSVVVRVSVSPVPSPHGDFRRGPSFS